MYKRKGRNSFKLMGYVNYYLKECQNTKEIKREKIELAKQIATEDIKYINRKT